MNANLTVADPLAGRETTIVITLAAGDRPREARPALVSLGVADEAPVIRSGLFGDLPALINEAWIAFGVRAQAAAPPATGAAEAVVATAVTDDEPPANPPAPPQPAARNLSLF
jgi:hypothetical protein